MAKFNKSVKAFTLAEVLITLAIIGVVAALTIPSVINSYRKETYVTQLKKNYSSINKAFRTMMAREGVYRLQDTDMWIKIASRGTVDKFTPKELASDEDIKSEFLKVFNIVSIYDGETNKIPVTSYKRIDNETAELTRGVYLADGTMLDFEIDPSPVNALGCGGETEPCTSLQDFRNNSFGGTDDVHSLRLKSTFWQRLGTIYIDVNGIKAPNTYGRDLFAFSIGGDGNLYPVGGGANYAFYGSTCPGGYIGGSYESTTHCPNRWKDSSFGCFPGSTSHNSGLTCTGRIMEEGWKMNY